MKLSITTEHTIWCERCNQWEQHPIPTKARFAKSMRRAGWRIMRGETICSVCVEEVKSGNEWDDVGYRRNPS